MLKNSGVKERSWNYEPLEAGQPDLSEIDDTDMASIPSYTNTGNNKYDVTTQAHPSDYLGNVIKKITDESINKIFKSDREPDRHSNNQVPININIYNRDKDEYGYSRNTLNGWYDEQYTSNNMYRIKNQYDNQPRCYNKYNYDNNQDVRHRNSDNQDVSHRNSDNRDVSHRNSDNQDVSHRNSDNRDVSHRNSDNQDVSHRNSDNRYVSHRNEKNTVGGYAPYLQYETL